MEKTTLELIWSELQKMNGRFEEVDKNFDQLWLELKNMNSRIDKRFDKVETRLERVETSLSTVRQQTAFLTEKAAEHDKKFDHIIDRAEWLRGRQDTSEVRIEKLEKTNKRVPRA